MEYVILQICERLMLKTVQGENFHEVTHAQGMFEGIQTMNETEQQKAPKNCKEKVVQ